MSTRWDAWRDGLTAELKTLAHGESIRTAGPVRTRDRGTGWFGRPRPPEVIAAPSVTLVRRREDILAQSVWAFPTGEMEPDEAQRQALREAGWLIPGDDDYVPNGGERFRVYIRRKEAAMAAELAVRTYVILGVHDPAEVTQERSFDRPGSHD